MRKGLKFGKFTLVIEGEEDLVNLLPREWDAFSCHDETEPMFTICLAKRELLQGGSSSDSWVYRNDGGCFDATYCYNGRARFSLQYDNSLKKIAVIVEQAIDRFLTLGIHYATMLALSRQAVGLHGVTMICKDLGIVLSAPSGTGKTTLSRLLQSYSDSAVINGDFALISIEQNSVIFEPTPFCGSSMRCVNVRIPIDRIVFLEQARQNVWCSVTGVQSVIRMMSNIFIPDWNEELRMSTQNIVMQVVSAIPMSRFAFEPTLKAAEQFFFYVTK